jgi:hypothetical protein
MEWLEQYHKNRKSNEKIEKRKIKEKLLNDIKKRHIQAKQNEYEDLKKRMVELEKEIGILK